MRKAPAKRRTTTAHGGRPSGKTVRSTGPSDQLYMAPGMPMHQQLGYTRMGSYSGRETLPMRPRHQAIYSEAAVQYQLEQRYQASCP